MNLIKSIVVLKKYPNLKREVRIGLTNESYPETGELSDLDLDDIAEIISELDALVAKNDPESYLEWGVDLFSVCSYPDISKCSDVIHDLDYPDCNTAHLLAFMRQLLAFKEQYTQPDTLKNILKPAFQQIKKDPSGFKKWEIGTYYETIVDTIRINLNLSEDDFQLTADEYIDQL
ncbi:hypothetical protein [Flavobacterium cerinum]|uniref:Uncharacterized protein n=1 Tax=Flavobacterium cerinum TaxID=2502784 RepID=A0ABY5IT51_9FLAO|nr:hypothetical protein [Flavobacterium cerinum]UUC45970.1 hypothetical protein NOX80_01915 [Flavobacterium cerinum]